MGIEIYVSIFSALIVLVLGLLQWKSLSRVQKADATEKIGNTYDGLLDRLNARIKALEDRVEYLEKQSNRYASWSARLVKQLVENGIEPLPMDTGPLNQKVVQ